MKSPIGLLLTVANIGGRISSAGDRLRAFLPPDCPLELKDEIRQHKTALLKLMRLTFLIVQSGVLDTIVLFVPDDATKKSLVGAGAEPGSIYTRDELGILVAGRITPKELQLFHTAKQQFNGEVRD